MIVESQRAVRVAMAVLTVGLAGCATFHGDPLKSLDIRTAGVNKIEINGDAVAVADLVSAVKSAGADRNTLITVEVAPDAPQSVGMTIRDTLVRNGFPKVVIALHRPPSATVAPTRVR